LPPIGLAVILAVGLTLAPSAVQAQQAKTPPRIGYLSPLTAAADRIRSEAFRQGLRELGYVEGRTIVIESRFAEGKLDLLPSLSAELVRLNVDVIIAAGGGFIGKAAKGATGTIPIVMTNVEDPVAFGLVTSLARPGGNVTGLTAQIPELSAKRLDLVRETVSNLSRVAVLWNSAYPGKETEFHQTQPAARLLGIQLHSQRFRIQTTSRRRSRRRLGDVSERSSSCRIRSRTPIKQGS